MFLFFIFTSLFPVIEADLSDSGCVDNVLELLVMAGGRSLPEVLLYNSIVARGKIGGGGEGGIEWQRCELLWGLGAFSKSNLSRQSNPDWKRDNTCSVSYKITNRQSLKQVFYLSKTQSKVLVHYLTVRVALETNADFIGMSFYGNLIIWLLVLCITLRW